jgi:hypothetical protein
MEALFRKNRNAALAHAGSFVLVLALFNYWSESKPHAKAQTFRYAIPNPKNFVGGSSCNSDNKSLVGNQISGKCQTDPIYAPPKKLWTFNVIYGVLTFFAITAFAHLFYATDGFGNGKYSEAISMGWNPYRWIEYGASASIMIVIIAYELGIRDTNHLISLVFMNIALQTCGYLVENALITPDINNAINTKTVNGATFVGWCLFIGSWIPILYAFKQIYDDINNNYNDLTDPDTQKKIRIPGFVWFILFVQLLNFGSFGIIQAMQVRDTYRGIAKPFEVYESRYLFLSYAGKLALAGGVAYGLLYRTKGCPT